MFARKCKPYVAVEPDYWELTVQTPSASVSWGVNIDSGVGVDIDVDWGDGGAVENFTSTGIKSHTYTNAGTYTVKLSGSFTSGGNIRLGTNVTNSAYVKATSVIPTIPGLAKFQSTFRDCTSLTSIPADLFRYNVDVSANGFRETFYGCTGLTSFPADLFQYNVNVGASGFFGTFYGCTGLTALPTDLFRYNVNVSSSGFYSIFQNCTGLTALPADLFRYNTAVSSSGFYATFRGCTGLTALPDDLFQYNVTVGSSGFRETFYGCTGLTTLPADLFRYNVNVGANGFRETFNSCTSLTSIPALLFKYNTVCTSFYRVFYLCNKLQLRADLFFDTGEEGTRFLNQTVDFTDAMRIGTFTGTQGTAPALWTCDFGTGTPTKTGCFTGHTTSSIDNHAAVVADGTWGLS